MAKTKQTQDTPSVAMPEPAALVTVIERALGECPEDIIGVLRSAEKALNWTDHLFRSVEREIDSNSADAADHVQQLARLGRHISNDFCNLIAFARGRMHVAACKAGIDKVWEVSE